MKRLSILAWLMLAIVCQSADAQWLHIYHMGVGHGDCTLIVARDGAVGKKKPLETKACIIDGGGIGEDRAKQIWASMKIYLQQNGASRINYYIQSHIHTDHIVGAQWLIAFARRDGFGCDTVIDRLYPKKKGTSRTLNNRWPYFPDRAAYDRYEVATKGLVRWNVQPGEYIYNMASFKMQCIAMNGFVWSNAGAQSAIATGSVDENELSYAWFIKYKDFKYFTAGDITGNPSGHIDVESELCTQLATIPGSNWHCCAFKVSHHGSLSSTNANFLNFFTPHFGVVSAKRKVFNESPNPLPNPDIITRLKNKGVRLFHTFVPTSKDPDNGNGWDPEFSKKDAGGVYMLRDVIIAVGRRATDTAADLNLTGVVQIEITHQDRDPAKMMGTGNILPYRDIGADSGVPRVVTCDHN